MKSLVTAVILFTFFISSCSDSPSSTAPETPQEVTYPFQSGTWTVTSPDDAEWTGSKSKSAGDTLVISSPAEHDIVISRDGWQGPYEEKGMFYMWINDHTITPDIIEQAGRFRGDLILPESIQSISPHAEETDSSLIAGSLFKYNCDPSSLEGEEDILKIEWYRQADDSLHVQYQFKTSGFIEAIHHIACGDSLIN